MEKHEIDLGRQGSIRIANADKAVAIAKQSGKNAAHLVLKES